MPRRAGDSRGANSSPHLNVTMDIDGATQTLAAFKGLPKEASEELRAAALDLAELLASRVVAAGHAEGRQAAKLAATVKVKRDRLPAFTVGGTSRIFRGRKDGTGAEAFRALFGSEFGGTGHGFKPHRGSEGYWIYPTLRANQSEIGARWTEAADAIVKKFSEGGGTS